MRATNGLDVPVGWGAGGRPAQARHRGNRAPRTLVVAPPTTSASAFRAGDTFRGALGGIYSLLADPAPCTDGSGRLELLLLNPSGKRVMWLLAHDAPLVRA